MGCALRHVVCFLSSCWIYATARNALVLLGAGRDARKWACCKKRATRCVSSASNYPPYIGRLATVLRHGVMVEAWLRSLSLGGLCYSAMGSVLPRWSVNPFLCPCYSHVIMPPPRALCGDRRPSSVRLSVWCRVAYIGSNSKTKRPRKTKLCTGVPQVTCDSQSHTDFKVKRSKVKVTGRGHIVATT